MIPPLMGERAGARADVILASLRSWRKSLLLPQPSAFNPQLYESLSGCVVKLYAASHPQLSTAPRMRPLAIYRSSGLNSQPF
jgi:hypothetical protein